MMKNSSSGSIEHEPPASDEREDALLRDAFSALLPLIPNLPSDRILGKFRIIRELSKGGCGRVYLAEQKTPARLVALKIPNVATWLSEHGIDRFFREAHAMAKLSYHPGIVPLFDFGEEDGLVYLAMPYYPDGSLAKFLGSLSVPLPSKAAAEIVREIGLSVQYAHGQGIYHRDLKPSNILLAKRSSGGENDHHFSFQPLLADFGMVKCLEFENFAKDTLTKTGAMIGTYEYMAPELMVQKPGEATAQSDIYSVGVILYELLTGRLPFPCDDLIKSKDLICNQEPTSPRSFNPKISVDLQTICLKCLEKKPQQRYSTVADLVADLNLFLGDEPIKARPISIRERGWRWIQKYPRQSFAALSIFTILLVGIIVLFQSWQNAETQRMAAMVNEQKAKENQRIANENFRQARNILKDLLLTEIERTEAVYPIFTARQIDILNQAQRRAEEWLAKNPNEAEFLQLLTQIYHWQGRIARNNHALQEAVHKFSSVINLLEEDFASILPKEVRLRTLVVTHMELADCYTRTSEIRHHTHLIKAFTLANDLCKQYPSIDNNFAGSNVALRLGSSYKFRNELQSALATYNKVVDDLRPFVQSEDRSIRFVTLWINATLYTGQLAAQLGHTKRAERIWTEGRRYGDKILGVGISAEQKLGLAQLNLCLSKHNPKNPWFVEGTAIFEQYLDDVEVQIARRLDPNLFQYRLQILKQLLDAYKVANLPHMYDRLLEQGTQTEQLWLRYFCVQDSHLDLRVQVIHDLVMTYNALQESSLEKKYVQLLEKDCLEYLEKKGKVDIGIIYAAMRCSEYLRKISSARTQRLLTLIKRALHDHKSDLLRECDSRLFYCLPAVARVFRQTGALTKAYEHAEWTLRWIDEHQQLHSDEILFYITRYDLYEEIGKIYVMENKHLQALEVWGKGVKFGLETLTKYPDAFQHRLQLQRRSLRLAESYLEEGFHVNGWYWIIVHSKLRKHGKTAGVS